MSSYRKRKMLWFLPAVAIAAAAAVAFDSEGLSKDRAVREETAKLKVENAGLAAEIARLTREAKALNDNPAAMERAAREELRYVRPGELVYRLDLQPGATP